jgi:hypothetical protein
MFDRIPLSGTLLLASIAACAWPQSGDSRLAAATSAKIQNSRENKGLCKSAKSADDFKALSMWCSDQSTLCRRKVAEPEAELKDYNSRPSPKGPKYPPRDQTIRDLISHYRILAAKWQESGENYTSRLATLEVANTKE